MALRSIAFRELTPTTFLERAAEVYGQDTAVVDGTFRATYAELLRRSRLLAGALGGAGVRPGDRVAVLAPNTHMLLEAHYGVPMAGAVLVALNTRLSSGEIAYILDHSGSSALLVDRDYLAVAGEAVGKLNARYVRVIDSADYESRLADAAQVQVEVADERSLLSLNYTSGTTGRPKGVMYHHRGAYLQALAMAFHARLGSDSRYLWTLPMFHTNGWCFPWAVTAAGATHLCLRKVDAAEIWRTCGTEGVTHFCAAPTVLAMLADHPDAAPTVGPVKVFTGGAPPWPSLLARMSELGFDVQHLYGLTETFGPAVICEERGEWGALSEAERVAMIARQGVANVVSEPVRVIDPEGAPVAADGVTLGEIALRGNNVMMGYYADDAATDAATANGWFRTGDLGVKHPDGYIELRDRAKDVIISGGENIASVEVEKILTEHPGVAEAAVVAMPHSRWGEVPVAFVSCRQGAAPTERELMDFVGARIARFKVPHKVVFGELPKTSTGKLQKTVLRQRLSSQQQ